MSTTTASPGTARQALSGPLLENIEVGPVSDADYEVRFEPSPRRVRAFVDGVAIADSARAMLMLETGRLPVYYLPIADVRRDLLRPSGHKVSSARKGEAVYFNIETEGRVVEKAAWQYPAPLKGIPDVSGFIAFHWNLMDSWFEEDEEVFVHARDPHKRVDVLESSRRVQVVLDGQTVADTRRARFLFETNLPTRYYIPKLDIRWDFLQPSQTQTACPYKGKTTAYWASRTTGKDIAWSYGAPLPECAKVANLVAFFNERVDAILVDDEEVAKTATPWS